MRANNYFFESKHKILKERLVAFSYDKLRYYIY